MRRNILLLVMAGLLAALFIWAPSFAGSAAEALVREAESVASFAKNGDWESCEAAAARLRVILDERMLGLKILFDHEEVDDLIISASKIHTLSAQRNADHLELELSGFLAVIDYVKKIDKLSWLNFL